MVVDNLATGFSGMLIPSARFHKISLCATELANVFEQERLKIDSHQAAQMVITKSAAEPVFDA